VNVRTLVTGRTAAGSFIDGRQAKVIHRRAAPSPSNGRRPKAIHCGRRRPGPHRRQAASTSKHKRKGARDSPLRPGHAKIKCRKILRS
jgi:hypothetical protein